MNRRIRRLAGVGFAVSTVAATGLLGVSTAQGNQSDSLGLAPVTSGAALACTGIGDADRALRAGCVQGTAVFRNASWQGDPYGEEYDAYENYLHERDQYERDTGRYDFDKYNDDDHDGGDHDDDHDDDRDGPRGRRHHDRTNAWVEGNYSGLSPYQDSWVAGLIEGSDWGQDFVIPYNHPGHPLASFPRADNGPSYNCTDPGTGAPYPCSQGGTGGPAQPGNPAPGSPANPAPGTPGAPAPGTPPATTAPPGTSRPNAPTTSRPLVPPATSRPTLDPSALGEEDSGIPIVTLLLVFLGSAGSVGAAYLMLRRRNESPLSGP